MLPTAYCWLCRTRERCSSWFPRPRRRMGRQGGLAPAARRPCPAQRFTPSSPSKLSASPGCLQHSAHLEDRREQEEKPPRSQNFTAGSEPGREQKAELGQPLHSIPPSPAALAGTAKPSRLGSRLRGAGSSELPGIGPQGPAAPSREDARDSSEAPVALAHAARPPTQRRLPSPRNLGVKRESTRFSSYFYFTVRNGCSGGREGRCPAARGRRKHLERGALPGAGAGGRAGTEGPGPRLRHLPLGHWQQSRKLEEPQGLLCGYRQTRRPAATPALGPVAKALQQTPAQTPAASSTHGASPTPGAPQPRLFQLACSSFPPRGGRAGVGAKPGTRLHPQHPRG